MTPDEQDNGTTGQRDDEVSGLKAKSEEQRVEGNTEMPQSEVRGQRSAVAETTQGGAAPVVVVRNPRVEIIDVFRFFAALWVMLGHAGPFPLLEGVTKSHLSGLVFRGVYNNLFVGPPAVIVFFVISGYCIHRPFRDIARLPLLTYFTRRYVRILFPMAFAILLAKPVGFPLPLFHDSILWSLVAELIYYTIYPILRPLATRIGWTRFNRYRVCYLVDRGFNEALQP